jgi:hypothetical protein
LAPSIFELTVIKRDPKHKTLNIIANTLSPEYAAPYFEFIAKVNDIIKHTNKGPHKSQFLNYLH